MEKLKTDLNNLNKSIEELETQINLSKLKAESNVRPLLDELEKVREDKRNFASKNDFESVQSCIRRENNLKFKINAQWNEYSILNDKLFKLEKQKENLKNEIRLEEDKIKRKRDVISQMDRVLANYEKYRNLMRAAEESKISHDLVSQWYEWGRNDFSQTSSYFYSKVAEIDDKFKKLESEKLKKQMDDFLKAFDKTDSLESASEIAGVSYDTVMYWYEWGSRGFDEENSYFFKKLDDLKNSKSS